jgi:hypothetical protein
MRAQKPGCQDRQTPQGGFEKEVVMPSSEQRDFVMARITAARAAVTGAVDTMDMIIANFLDPSEDADMKVRAQLAEEAEDYLDEAAVSLMAAVKTFSEVDGSEGEPDLSYLLDEDGESEEDDDEAA